VNFPAHFIWRRSKSLISLTKLPSKYKLACASRLLALGGYVYTNPPTFEAGAELSCLRTFSVLGPKVTKGSAQFFVLFGGSGGSKVEEVKFIAGSEELKNAGKFLSATDFKVVFPDDGPERLVRRGILYCDPTTKCTFVLYPPGSVQSVD